MAELTNRERLQPSLLDRLADEAAVAEVAYDRARAEVQTGALGASRFGRIVALPNVPGADGMSERAAALASLRAEFPAAAAEIDAAAKTITQVAKDGKKSTNSVTATTVIENDKKPAKFEDIKVGDMVSGNRTKTGDGTYDIVKITKFGAKAEKPAAGGAKKPAGDAKKPAEKPAEKKDDAPAKPAAQ